LFSDKSNGLLATSEKKKLFFSLNILSLPSLYHLNIGFSILRQMARYFFPILTCAFLSLFVHPPLQAQGLNNLRHQTIRATADTIFYDTLATVSSSMVITDTLGRVIDTSAYTLLPWESGLVLSPSLEKAHHRLHLTYRVMPEALTESRFHKDLEAVSQIPDRVFTWQKIAQKQPDQARLFPSAQFIQSGSISRGITLGNNQDAVVNSGMDLQLSGSLGNNLNINGVLSDRNIPIQPDGTTQKINELDRVYLQVYNDQTRVTGGDFEISANPGYFMRLNKKVQGARVEHRYQPGGQAGAVSTISGAVSKGKHCSIRLNGEEGNQGPYRLRGCDGETHIIILSGSEKVFIDGKLLKRGKNHDYTIHYNTSEITFTANQPITKDKRIRVEFEYSLREYTRFMAFSHNRLNTERGSLWLNVYTQQDSKNQTLAQDLTSSQKELLSGIGDNLEEAMVPYVDTGNYENRAILYTSTDTVVNGQTYSIYVYSTDRDKERVKVGFSYAGKNGGHYILKKSPANGRVYEWVAPVNGTPRGEYTPMRRLIPPQKQHMLTLGGAGNLSPTLSSSFEMALSNHDPNTFSALDQADNNGYALRFGLNKQFLTDDTSRSRLSSTLSYRGVHRHFTPVERFRAVEFDRDWNLRNRNVSGHEHLASGGIQYWHEDWGKSHYRLEYLGYNSGYEGYRNQLGADLSHRSYNLQVNGNVLNTRGRKTQTRFYRYKADLSKHFTHLIAGASNAGEYNHWRQDSLLSQSFSFNQWQFYVKTPDSLKNQYSLSYKLRNDRLPDGKSLKTASRAQDLNLGIRINSLQNNRLEARLTYRKLHVADTSLSPARPEDHLIGRLEHNLRAFNNLISTSTHYEVGAGLEPRKEFTYIEVAGGQGTYTWSDYNNNGIRELDEFEKARFTDQATFLRVYRPSGDYFKTHTGEFNQIINIDPEKAIADTSLLAQLASRFSNQLAFRIRSKNQKDNLWKNLNPFAYAIDDAAVLSQSSNLRNTLSFNKNNPAWHIDYIFLKSQSKVLLMNGTDWKEDQKHSIHLTWNIQPGFSVLNKSRIGQERYESEFFQNKNYRIKRMEESLSIRYQPSDATRFELGYAFADLTNTPGREKAIKHRIGLEFHLSRIRSFRLQGNTRFIHFRYGYEANTPVAWQMLEGLKPGNNATWSLMLQKQLYQNLELNVNYSGRVSQGHRTIHTGQLELRASF